MKLVEFLQGKWLGHPLHPALVHVPVGGWVVAFALDMVGWLGRGGGLPERVAFWCVVVGLVGALLAMAPGVADWAQIKKEKPAWKLGLYHMALNLVAALVWAVNLGLRAGGVEARTGVAGSVVATSAVGMVLVFAGAYLGKLMVFDQGIGVARDPKAKRKWREVAERGGANLAPEKK